MSKTVRLTIDDEIDLPLRPALNVFAAMRTGLAKAELTKQRGKFACLGVADGEFDKAHATAARPRLKCGDP